MFDIDASTRTGQAHTCDKLGQIIMSMNFMLINLRSCVVHFSLIYNVKFLLSGKTPRCQVCLSHAINHSKASVTIAIRFDSIRAKFALDSIREPCHNCDSIRARFKHPRKNEHVQFFPFSNGAVANQANIKLIGTSNRIESSANRIAIVTDAKTTTDNQSKPRSSLLVFFAVNSNLGDMPMTI